MAYYPINQPLLCLPKLVEQPTWGGRLILKLKGLDKEPGWLNKKVGQSYELFGGTIVKVNGRKIALNNLLHDHAEEILGSKVLHHYGLKMPLLIKLTQAKGNSYQIHLKHGVCHPHWKPKAEAWYYLDRGLITLGIKPDINWADYEKTVRVIATKMEALSQQLKKNKLAIEEARIEAQKFIKNHDPSVFVNQVIPQEGEVWDLSAGGLHHSWEEDKNIAPQGNLLYEIQEDVSDEDSTIRAFDKGKFKDDGSIRNIHIEDYFQLIDRSPEANNPDVARHQSILLEKSSGGQVIQLLKTPPFALGLFIITGEFSTKATRTGNSFHHLFAKMGQVVIHYGHNQEFKLSQGASILMPASIGQYGLSSKEKAEIIKSFIEPRGL